MKSNERLNTVESLIVGCLTSMAVGVVTGYFLGFSNGYDLKTRKVNVLFNTIHDESVHTGKPVAVSFGNPHSNNHLCGYLGAQPDATVYNELNAGSVDIKF